jgi:uncharacterized OB-fold protein
VTALGRMDRAMAEAQQFAIQQILASTYHQQVVFDRRMRGIMSVTTHACPRCGQYFGDAYPYFNWCPNCGTAL